MPFKINSQTMIAFAEEKFGHRPDLQKDLLGIANIYKDIGTGTLRSVDIAGWKSEILSAITAALSAARRLLDPKAYAALDVAAVSALDRFAVIHFASAQHAFLSSLEQVIITLQARKEETRAPQEANGPARRIRGAEGTQHSLELVQTVELPYTMAVNPSTILHGYFRELLDIILNIINNGHIVLDSSEPLTELVAASSQIYTSWVMSGSEAATAVRSFLNFDQQETRKNVVLDDVGGLSIALENWLKADQSTNRRKKKWDAYRKTLAELPDDKITMFDENFGVRKVFVQPTAHYQVAGVRRSKPAEVPDVAGLLGTLISDRTDSEDLILLCGGPGSGKSTLCRVLASELAGNEQVHPVFLRLRRLQDSQEIAGFIEAHLQQEGLIDRLTDLADVPNLVLILDGFDELVMASRSRLREFFNALKDDLSTGPLRNAKAIVSGRDTLFPNGAGLPIGAHVISLLPFDGPRISAWGQKWRAMHLRDEAKSFYPENLLPNEKQQRKKSPLEHLVSWPLTLHLVARAHTSGSIDLTPDNASQFEKAVLYRSIVADTALRQENQTTGKGRLDPKQMRRFVQAIAWEMYSSGREALDVSEGLPILKSILPGATDADLAELADVTIVNQPELTKGDETGFEFVHKSFSEYFAAEQIATGIERVCFQSEQWGVDEKTWQMSVPEASKLLSSQFAIRLLTSEVQEMLEPMLGDFGTFVSDNHRAQEPDSEFLTANIQRKLQRFIQLAVAFAGGELLETVSAVARDNRPPINSLEAFGNYASGLLFVAGALAGRSNKVGNSSSRQSVKLPSSVLMRLIHIVLSGDIQIDAVYSDRGLRNIDLKSTDKEVTEWFFPPIPPVYLRGIKGLNMPLSNAISSLQAELVAQQLENLFLGLFVDISGPASDILLRHRHRSYDFHRRDRGVIEYLQRIDNQEMSFNFDEAHYRFEKRLLGIAEELKMRGVQQVSPQLFDEVLSNVRELAYRAGSEGLSSRTIFQRAEHLLRDLFDIDVRRIRRGKPKI